jgi:hypothetical protein
MLEQNRDLLRRKELIFCLETHDDYKIPICDCGTELVMWREQVYSVTTKINKNGKVSKREHKVYTDDSCDRLRCPKCLNEYDFSWDKQQRIIRGEEM